MNVLSIDWDYFCSGRTVSGRESFDPKDVMRAWRQTMRRHKEREFRLQVYSDFWARIYGIQHIKRIIVADSHGYAGEWWLQSRCRSIRRVVHFDAHHDLGYHAKPLKELDCGNWLSHVLNRHKRAHAHIVHPMWRGGWDLTRLTAPRHVLERVHFHTERYEDFANPTEVFIARSDAWSPPWFDEHFIKFVTSLAEITGAVLLRPFMDTEHVDPMVPRNWRRR